MAGKCIEGLFKYTRASALFDEPTHDRYNLRKSSQFSQQVQSLANRRLSETWLLQFLLLFLPVRK